MKTVSLSIVLMFWLIATLILAVSVVGIIVISVDEWMEFPEKIIDKIR